VFTRGSNLQIFHKWFYGTGWSGWESLGGTLTSGPDASSCAAGHLDLFALGTDHGGWQRGFNGSAWGGWQALGGRFLADPGATCLTGTTNVELFQAGVDRAVWYTTLPAT
jgi:hypothetical protein